MDQGSGSGHPRPAAISATVKSVIANNSTELQAQAHPAIPIRRHDDHAVADLFGRCFLRVCYWVDVFSSMTRRGEPLAYVPFPLQQAASVPLAERPAKPLIDGDAASPGTPVGA
jgi:hypothetical protein